jgi:hypothetical protein
MDIIELFIDEEDQVSGIEAVSIVENPAIEEDFIALKNQEFKLAEVNKEKRILMGAALIPNKPIYRKNEDNEYYIYFSRDTVRKASELFFIRGNYNKSTLEHNLPLQGLVAVESWIVEDTEQDKSRKYGMDVPLGTWMLSMKVLNDDVWNDYVKTGKVKGFSIEGYFADKLERPNEPNKLEQIQEEEAEFLLGQVKAIIKKDKRLKKGKRIEFESYSDYPNAVKNNAQRGIDLNAKVNNKCATQVGKIRASQLAQGKPISIETIKRMYSFLSRAGEYYDEGNTEACGTISYLLWGGKAGLRWSESKLKELEMLAEVGKRGGIKKSPKAPKSDTPNPKPKGEGTAKGDASTSRGAKVSKQDEETLRQKAKEFNERYKKKLGYGANVGTLKAVFQRGLGAFNVSHSPKVKSASQWSFARVNAFLYLLKNGRPQNPKYTGDFDLLPAKHPKSPKK